MPASVAPSTTCASYQSGANFQPGHHIARSTTIGTPTPDPRPYITITAMGSDAAAVQYQWCQGQDPACCPTGIGSARFKIEDGKLKALDPIPNP